MRGIPKFIRLSIATGLTGLIAAMALAQDNQWQFAGQIDEQVYWLGDEPCDDLLEQTIPKIPGGFPLKYKNADGFAHYSFPGGGSLQLQMSLAEKVSVQGASFEEAYRNLVAQKPLQDSADYRGKGVVVFAAVETNYQLDLDFIQNEDLTWFAIKPGGYNVVMQSSFNVIDWTGYNQADAASRAKWDKLTCESYHHELGHVLIGAQLFAEAEPLWVKLKGADEKSVQSQTDAIFDLTMQRVRNRQIDYHREIDFFGRDLADSRPYLELPFSWLR